MTTNLKSFADFGVEPAIDAALADAGITTPFPIQELTLPLALAGADIIGQARTGTGKTLAFGIPLLSRADPALGIVQALVIVPTRELCLQVTGDLNQAGVQKGVDVVAVYGGRAIEPQVQAIRSGASVVVGTPGRLLDLLRRGDLDLSKVLGLVLDEADEMLDLGFLPDVEQLIQACQADRQTMLFSATMPSQVVALARRYMHKPTFLRADIEEVSIAPETTQYFFSCHRLDKPAVLARILQTPKRGLCLVFTRTKRMADILAEELRGRGIAAAPIHSDMRQEARERALSRFRRGKVDVLVATEVAARGLDITDVTHVVNYDCPDDEKMYLHRIGRTGRAGAAGVAITLAVWNELARLEMIKKALDITDPTHEVFSTSPILDELFDLPPRAPRAPVVDDEDDDEPIPVVEAPAEEAPRGRRRRGRRGRRAEETAPQPAEETVPQPAAEEQPPSPPVRTRRRRVFGRSEAPPPEVPAAEAPVAEPPVAEAPEPAAEPEPEPAATPEAETAERRVRVRTRSTRGEAERRREPERQRQRRDGDRSRSASGTRSRRPRPAQRVDAATARGTGKPALTRPMVILHLP